MVTADGYRLAKRSVTLPVPAESEADVLIPAQSLRIMAKVCEGPVQLMVPAEKAQVYVRAGDTMVVSQKIEGQYVDYQRIIPRVWNTRAVFDVGEMVEAVRLAALFSDDKFYRIALHLEPSSETAGRIAVSATSAQMGSHDSEIVAKVEGSGLRFKLNALYLRDALNALPDGEAVFEVTAATCPVVLKPANSDDLLHVIMPLSYEHYDMEAVA